MSRFINAIVLAVALLVVAPASPARASEPQDWRLLYADGALRDGLGALKSEIDSAGRFSPDGTLLAAGTIRDGEGTVRIHKPDGTSFLLARVPDFDPMAVAWSPDQSLVAVLGRVITPDDIDNRIYLFPTDGSPAIQVYSDTMLVRINVFDGLSWNPSDDRLAFIASEFEKDGSSYYSSPGGTDQVWTVAAAPLSTPDRYSGTPVCGDCTHVPGYSEPTWSPDGSRLAVAVDDPTAPWGEQVPAFLGYLDEGALSARRLNDAIPQGGMAWSDDGEHLAYGIYDTSGDFYDETEIVDADTGVVVTVVEGVIAPFADWLPCPGGSCQVWQDVYVPPAPSMNIKGVAKRDTIKVSGELARVPEVASVRITVHKRSRAGAPWRKVTTVQVQAVEGLFERSFPRPKGTQCRARGVYDDGTSRAVDAAVFSC